MTMKGTVQVLVLSYTRNKTINRLILSLSINQILTLITNKNLTISSKTQVIKLRIQVTKNHSQQMNSKFHTTMQSQMSQIRTRMSSLKLSNFLMMKKLKTQKRILYVFPMIHHEQVHGTQKVKLLQ